MKEIGLHAQNLHDQDRGNLHDHSRRKRIFTLMMSKLSMEAPKVMRKMVTASIWVSILPNTCFITFGDVT